jgi:D-amino peptidase
VADKHGRGKNFIWYDLHEAARYVIGRTQNTPGGRLPGLEGSDGLILLGYHAMAGTPHAVLEHTWSGTGWQNYWVNGKPSGEIVMEMGLAADAKVPVIMISGDDKVCAEAETLVPGIVKAEVKQSLTLTGALLLSRPAAHRLIREKSAEAVKACKTFKPVDFGTPVTMRLEGTERSEFGSVIDKPFAKQIDARTVEVVGDTFTQAFFRLMQL